MEFPIKIGLRTIKTAISATLAMTVANWLHLDYGVSAGVIAILSVTNEAKTTFVNGGKRFLSLVIALLLSSFIFTVFGYSYIDFGIFVLLFIPISVRLGMTDGIVVSSVLVTHVLLAKEITPQLIVNETLLMVVGVGIALIANLCMPKDESEEILKKNQEQTNLIMKNIFQEISQSLNNHDEEKRLAKECKEYRQFIEENIKLSQTFEKRKFIRKSDYYIRFFQMRLTQAKLLTIIIERLDAIDVEKTYFDQIASIFHSISVNISVQNDGTELLREVHEAYEHYRKSELPKTREEFENRAILFIILQLLENLIQTKRDYTLELRNASKSNDPSW
ncbi:MAG: aromatic acid exporter family protein [Streptococcaceae bacterium]|jgi:uncharacterized membrane protein YgaE (UPF0421/DUF939 family)|nr:aromatic acid exporter family protein [Streptococcaceae bacterium]